MNGSRLTIISAAEHRLTEVDSNPSDRNQSDTPILIEIERNHQGAIPMELPLTPVMQRQHRSKHSPNLTVGKFPNMVAELVSLAFTVLLYRLRR
jgi:hypothetical protein